MKTKEFNSLIPNVSRIMKVDKSAPNYKYLYMGLNSKGFYHLCGDLTNHTKDDILKKYRIMNKEDKS